jgi:hypothetical protein
VDHHPIVLFAVVVIAGCNSNGATADAGLACTPDDATFACTSSSLPGCPVSASEGYACGYDGGPCVGCYQNTGFTCICTDAGASEGGGPQWQCIGTGSTCQ